MWLLPKHLFSVSFWSFLLSCSLCHGIIIYGKDNTANQSNPGIGGAWDSVVTLAKPSQTYNASGIYLGNGYFLTARHVDAVAIGQQVKINGTLYDLDTSFDVDGILRVEDIPGVDDPVDMKIFRVLLPPILASASLNTNGVNDILRYSYLVGNGVGKGTDVLSQGWNWGNDTTRAKRWATNYTLDASDSAFLSGLADYSALGTVFFSEYGANTGSATLGDSGSALFQYLGGQWVVSGLVTFVEVNGSSFYNRGPSDPVNPDYSAFVRMSAYSSAILSVIPEPTSAALCLLAGLAMVCLRASSNRGKTSRQ